VHLSIKHRCVQIPVSPKKRKKEKRKTIIKQKNYTIDIP
jgi:hypothetical protein